MAYSYRSSESSRLALERVASPNSVPPGPYAQQLATALVGRNKERALSILERAGDEGWELREVEEQIIAPAVTRLGQLWIRGRLDDGGFRHAGALAENVERSYRSHRFQDRPVARQRHAVKQGA